MDKTDHIQLIGWALTTPGDKKLTVSIFETRSAAMYAKSRVLLTLLKGEGMEMTQFAAIANSMQIRPVHTTYGKEPPKKP